MLYYEIGSTDLELNAEFLLIIHGCRAVQVNLPSLPGSIMAMHLRMCCLHLERIHP